MSSVRRPARKNVDAGVPYELRCIAAIGVGYSDTFILHSLQIGEESNMSAIGRVGGPKLVSGGIGGKDLEVRVPSFRLSVETGKADVQAHRSKYQAFAIAGNIEFCIVALARRDLPQSPSI